MRQLIVTALAVLLQGGFAREPVSGALESVVAVQVMRRTTCAGVVYQPGVVVTAAHCLERVLRDTISVAYRSGASRPAEIAHTSPEYDLAVLRVDTSLGSPARVATWHYVGQAVMVVGHPMGVPWVVTAGVLSAEYPDEVLALPSPLPDSTVRYGTARRHLFVSDAMAALGVSGGGWFDEYGRFLAVHVLSLYDPDSGLRLSVSVGYPTVGKYFKEVAR
jgi:S1-C subfamily serine protease